MGGDHQGCVARNALVRLGKDKVDVGATLDARVDLGDVVRDNGVVELLGWTVGFAQVVATGVGVYVVASWYVDSQHVDPPTKIRVMRSKAAVPLRFVVGTPLLGAVTQDVFDLSHNAMCTRRATDAAGDQ